jgi:hypothetical protein
LAGDEKAWLLYERGSEGILRRAGLKPGVHRRFQ